MITWIQRYLQHHFKVIFALLLAVIIVSFVFITNTSGGFGDAGRRVVDRPFFSYNLSLADDQQRLMGDASLSANLQLGGFGMLESEQIQSYAFQRAAALHLADQWNIPAATQAEIKDAIKNLRMFAGQDGQFDPQAYARFRDSLKTDARGITEADIARVLGDDVRADKVNKLLAGPGYVLPIDVKKQLERADTTWTLATATADYAAFQPDIKPSDAELTKYFEENSFRYEIPPRVVATYIDFPAGNYLPAVNVTEAEVRAFYDANPARFPKPSADPTKPVVPDPTKPADPNADFAAVRPQVEAALKQERAQKLAAQAASDFAVALFERRLKPGPSLDAFLASSKLTPKPLAPFTREAGPAEFGGSPEIANEAFKLSEERFASEALLTPSGAVILFWKETQPARKPLLMEVRDKVAADYIENEKRKRFVDLGRNAKNTIEARLKAGDAFEKAVAAAASATGLKLEAKTLAPFTVRTRPQDIDYSVLGTLERLDQGEVSDMTIAADKGVLVYAMDKKAPDLSEGNPRFVETRNQLASFTARLGGSQYISELVEQELKKSEPKVQ